MIKELRTLKNSIDTLLEEAIQIVEKEPIRAMDKIDMAKGLFHKFNYRVWLHAHTSGKVGK